MFTSSSPPGVPPDCRLSGTLVDSLSLQFSDDGPAFPSGLVDAIMDGEVVFLCGSGVSSKKVSDFKGLVKRTYEELGLDRLGPEKKAFSDGRFDEVLGLLSRRLADSEYVTRAVSDVLTLPDNQDSEPPDFENHSTILRLSRYRDNRIAIVTTNFDTLFERAFAEQPCENSPKDISFAGQSLPAPGTSEFGGIIHIHGRIKDSDLDLEQSQLVLTSSDFGDAYMRSGWASRFLFDLVRCKNIVLVGYSANDVPMRYVLNVLEADRARFSDLKNVYAFAGHEGNRQDTNYSWQALAVEPLAYEIVGKNDHRNLWRDLEELAEFIEFGRKAFQALKSNTLSQCFEDSCDRSKAKIAWLLKRHEDLWSAALDTITDSKWFDYFLNCGLWSKEHVAYRVAAWVKRDLENAARLKCALKWQGQIRRPFTDQMDRWLQTEKGMSNKWSIIWRLFSQCEPGHRDDKKSRLVQKPLSGEILVDSDIRAALNHLVPKLELLHSHSKLDQTVPIQGPLRLHDLLGASLDVSNCQKAMATAETLCRLPKHSPRILELASCELRSLLELDRDLEFIVDDEDSNDRFVPAVEYHPQNEFCGGKTHLVQLLSTIVSQSHEIDQQNTLAVVHSWKYFPGRLGIRLYLHALRDTRLFSADDAVKALLSVSDFDFWQMLREPLLLIKERAGNASPELLDKLEQRIIKTSHNHYGRDNVESGEFNCQNLDRDEAVWIRLKMLEESGVISQTGADELDSVVNRNSQLNRAVMDHDFFRHYAQIAQFIDGNADPILQADANDRLKTALEMISGPYAEYRKAWSTYCKSHPEKALASLIREGYIVKYKALWNVFLYVLASPSPDGKTQRESLRAQALDYLFTKEAYALQPIAGAICNLICTDDRSRIGQIDEWFLKLWQLMTRIQAESCISSDHSYDKSLDSSTTRLVETLLEEINFCLRDDPNRLASLMQLLVAVGDSSGRMGFMGRKVLVHQIKCIIDWECSTVVEKLGRSLSADTKEGELLRAVLLQDACICPTVTVRFNQVILKGISECNWEGSRSKRIARWIIMPAIADSSNDSSYWWGISAKDARNSLKQPCPTIRIGALDALHEQLKQYSGSPENAFVDLVAPFFRNVWPKESKYRDPEQTHGLVSLLVSVGQKFPDALKALRPYICPTLSARTGLYMIAESDLPQRFPTMTLELIWIICGQRDAGHYFDLAELIDQILSADPTLEADRRLQELERLADRSGWN